MEEKSSKSAHDIVEGMMRHLIETRVRKEPYIVVVSKKQLWFGNGIFKDATDPDCRHGLRKFIGVKIPTDREIEAMNLRYGYPALVKPWSHMNNITNHAIRTRVLWNMINGKDLCDTRPILGQGYVRKDGTIDPQQTKGISCYVLFLADPNHRQDQNDWIRKQDDWIRWQILRNQVTHRDLLTEKKKQASTIVQNNTKLLQMKEYLELDPHVDRENIPWDDYRE